MSSKWRRFEVLLPLQKLEQLELWMVSYLVTIE